MESPVKVQTESRGGRTLALRDLFDDFWSSLRGLGTTLRQLIARPGSPSLEYLQGARDDHVAPFRLYFALSAVFFTAASLIPVDARFGLLAFAKYHPNLFSVATILSLPFLGFAFQLLHLGSGRRYTEHLVVSIHYLGAYFVGATVTIGLGALALLLKLDGLVSPLWYVFGISTILYLTAAATVVYRQKWYVSALKAMFVMIAQFWIVRSLTNALAELLRIFAG